VSALWHGLQGGRAYGDLVAGTWTLWQCKGRGMACGVLGTVVHQFHVMQQVVHRYVFFVSAGGTYGEIAEMEARCR
jgi:hypothetical protein